MKTMLPAQFAGPVLYVSANGVAPPPSSVRVALWSPLSKRTPPEGAKMVPAGLWIVSASLPAIASEGERKQGVELNQSGRCSAEGCRRPSPWR